MNKQTRKIIHILFSWAYMPIRRLKWKYEYNRNVKHETQKLLPFLRADSLDKKRVYYLGITAHSNLGDMAQYYCICRWIGQNYPNHELIKIESDIVVDNRFGFMEAFKNAFRINEDIIIFQSGYTTQDLGGNHEYMHRLIIENLPNAHILMMPQTIFFKKKINKQRTAKIYNTAKKMLFLARDFTSFEIAKQMFPDISVEAYPDIVTSLIGTLHFKHQRKGVCLCVRNDGEKFYSDNDLSKLKSNLEKVGAEVTITDTTIKTSYLKIRKNIQHFIEEAIEKFSYYDVTITDRYHGTIFSLVAGTPVIIIKSNDHKVVTGADWFKGVYDDYVFVAKDLDDAITIYSRIKQKSLNCTLQSYFADQYYNKLESKFKNIIK
ncbi:polysaccharide pyruvyl transferase family protein [Bacteroides sp.]|uniref:polysaccharide pyruvyl transferase family protein n=1 Tax=Bacteroides sp. TaxID=29523 RepID=UPI002631F372|nr:polysaccharide pyruvyl transferase family protein [Bacteroides sp.]